MTKKAHRGYAALSTLALLCMGAIPTQAAQPIGSTVAIVNLVTGAINRDVRTLRLGDRVHQDERIEVGTDGRSEFKLDDDTKLALGPGARMTLDKFVYDPDKKDGSIVVNLIKGTFRFITGVAVKPAYVIRTPVASITVRGTIFDLFIQDAGLVWILLHEGAVRVCNDRAVCSDFAEPGKLMRILGDGSLGAPVRWAGLPGAKTVPFGEAFPFVVTAPTVDPNPIYTEETITGGKDDGNDDNIVIPPPPRNTGKPPKGPPTRVDPQPKKPIKVYTPKYDPPPKRVRETKKPKKDASGPVLDGIKIGIGIGLGIGKGKHNGMPDGGGYGGRNMPNKGGGGGMMPRGGGMMPR